jgi:hypothetical protein
MSSGKILPSNHKAMTFCYDARNTNWTSYFVVPDHPTVVAPLPHRPTWKGQTGTPNRAPSTLLESPEIGRPTFASPGFIPHSGEFRHYQSAIDAESSLRNLDNRLSRRAFGQRVIPELKNPSIEAMNLIVLPDYRAKPIAGYEGEETVCGILKKYASNDGMNGARFNNSTRTTTRNLLLPFTNQNIRAALEKGKPGYVPS